MRVSVSMFLYGGEAQDMLVSMYNIFLIFLLFGETGQPNQHSLPHFFGETLSHFVFSVALESSLSSMIISGQGESVSMQASRF